MNTLKNLKLISKLAIPVAILIAVSLGMVLLARSNLSTLDAITRDTVEVGAGRVIRVQQLAFAIDETTIRDKNAIIETDPSVLARQVKQFEADKTRALTLADELIALSSSPERRAINAAIKSQLVTYLASVEKGMGYGLAGDKQMAAKISGSGSIEAGPKDEADVTLSGAGRVRLLTRPASLNSKVSGSGRIIQPPLEAADKK